MPMIEQTNNNQKNDIIDIFHGEVQLTLKVKNSFQRQYMLQRGHPRMNGSIVERSFANYLFPLLDFLGNIVDNGGATKF